MSAVSLGDPRVQTGAYIVVAERRLYQVVCVDPDEPEAVCVIECHQERVATLRLSEISRARLIRAADAPSEPEELVEVA